MSPFIINLLISSGWDIKRAAKQIAQRFSVVRTIEDLERVSQYLGIKPLKGKNIDGRIQRSQNPGYWRKNLGPISLRYREQQNRKNGYVGRKTGYALSDPIYNLKSKRDASNQVLLEEDLVALSDHGDIEPVAKLAERGVSNPKNRRAELMTRISGMERYAVSKEFVATFITLTLPGAYHPIIASTGRKNSKYNGTDPIEANRWFVKRWSWCRAALADIDLPYFGLKVIEPHHDGTPHWHLVLFTPKDSLTGLKNEITKQFSKDHSHPHIGIKALDADPEKGSAAAYMAKYVSKNIDGEGLDVGEKKQASRAVAWARVWGFHQFDQLGGPSVTIWRELRKIRTNTAVPADMMEAWQAANDGDWCAYTVAMGGPFQGRNVPIKLKRDYKVGINGERTPETNQYGEPLKTDTWDMRPVVGLQTELNSLKTYNKFWVIERLSEMVSAQEPVGRVGPWTCDNNCKKTHRRLSGSAANPV